MTFLQDADETRWQRWLEHNPAAVDTLQDELQLLLKCSPFAFEQLIRYPSLFEPFKTRQSLDPVALAEQQLEAIDTLDQEAAMAALRNSRNQAQAAIVWNEVVLQQSCEDTLRQCSDLADSLIKIASRWAEQQLQKRYGIPVDAAQQPLKPIILAMGKLGGRELNFSSDIDLVLFYESDGEFKSGFTYQEYYLQWARSLNKLLGEITPEGFVFRVDFRLRPWGQSGPLVMSLDGFEQYLSLHARQWERYAMVKSRIIDARSSASDDYHALHRPFVYRRYHDHAVFAGLRELKEKINREVRLKDVENHVKLGRGGIREIEFVVQALQILRGGRNHSLQTPQILEVLALDDVDLQLRDQNISGLLEPYLKLRQIENCIQMMQDQQQYTLPEDKIAQARLCACMGYNNWSDLQVEFVRIQFHVRRLFDALFSAPNEEHPEKELLPFEVSTASREQWLYYLQDQELPESERLADTLINFTQSTVLRTLSAQGQARLAWLMPVLLQKILPLESRTELLERILGLLLAVSGRSIYMELLKQQPVLLERLLHILAQSAWVARELTRFPFLLEEILRNYRLSNAMDPEVLAHELQHQLDNCGDDQELRLDKLRQFKRSRTIWVASAELAGDIKATEASQYLSQLADTLLIAALYIAEQEAQARYGKPFYMQDGERIAASMAIIAYGRLGAQELQYSSDLDLIFLHDSGTEEAVTDGAESIENAQYFSRLAQKIISIVTLMTASGKLYEIDMRLRPDGSSGLLVSNLIGFSQYQHEHAWTWEHQALTRSRFVSGSLALQSAFNEIRSGALQQPREADKLRLEIIQMRDKMREQHGASEPGEFHLKQDDGGLIDIEFIAQYLLLLHSHKHPALQQYSATIPALHALAQAGIETQCCTQLAEIYPRMRSRMHLAALQQATTTIEAESMQEDINRVRECWSHILPNN